ncbi:MAG: hypothetical protein ACYDGM_01535 [Vulcanimicrobiaceae bacterium]
MDLQLAYLAGPQNAALVNSAENAPQVAQQAAQVSFANQVHEREETVDETADTEGAHLRADADGHGNGGGYTPRQHQPRGGSAGEAPPVGLCGDGEHFIDVIV